jgi:hypothetical protein
MKTFADLDSGDSFDFIGPVPRFNSFFERCTKTGPRSYSWFHPQRHGIVNATVGTITCKVFHVKRKEKEE